MTSGLDYDVVDNDCTDPTCLNYLGDAGSFWYYYNAPYRLINNVIESATGINYNSYTNSRVKTRIGMSSGIWVQDVFYSRTRDAARFGLLMLGKGIWNSDTLMHDTNYYNAMINTSQAYNESYGYLWWLNGKSSNMLPGTSLVFQGEIVPNAPADMYAALGKNDQKIYVVPSENMVVVRMGNSAELSLFAVSNFDNELWARVSTLECSGTGVNETTAQPTVSLYPNPTANNLTISFSTPLTKSSIIELYNFNGQLIYGEVLVEGSTTYNLNIGTQPSGIYIYKVQTDAGYVTGKVVIE
jgi:CubicO group peptidase (beta-lactamase class C family)